MNFTALLIAKRAGRTGKLRNSSFVSDFTPGGLPLTAHHIITGCGMSLPFGNITVIPIREKVELSRAAAVLFRHHRQT
jgi:hypothetical protein